MDRKQQSLLVLKSLISENKEETINADFLLEKLDTCMELVNPEVLLSQKAKGLFNKFAVELSNKGKIIYKSKVENKLKLTGIE